MTASAARGLVDQDSFFTKQVAAKDTSSYYIAKPGQLVYNKSTSKDAPFGAVVQHPGGPDGVVTPLYIVFEADGSRTSNDFLKEACNSPQFFDSLRDSLREGARTHGLLNVRLNDFFAARVPMPPRRDQERIVDLLRAADAVVSASRFELDVAASSLREMRDRMFEDLWTTAPLHAFSSIAHEVKRPVSVEASAVYDQIGVRSHGRGVFRKEAVSGLDLGSKKVFWVEPGDLVINIVFAWEGAVALVPDDVTGHCASHRFPAYRRQDSGPIDYLRHLLLSARGMEAMQLASPGGAGRNRTLNRRLLGNFEVPVPAPDLQYQVARTLGAMESLKESLDRALASSRLVRSSLHASLMSGSIEIPESYDDLIDVADLS